MNSSSDLKREDQEEPYEILLRRTKELSIKDTKSEDDEEKHYFLNFSIRNTGYALPIDNVYGVISSFALTRVPDLPDFISGITDYRGKIIAIFDFQRFLDNSPMKIKPDSKLILISHNNVECGVLADRIYDVLDISLTSIEKNISTIEENTAHYLKGMIRVDGTFYAIIDVPQVFESDKIASLKELAGI